MSKRNKEQPHENTSWEIELAAAAWAMRAAEVRVETLEGLGEVQRASKTRRAATTAEWLGKRQASRRRAKAAMLAEFSRQRAARQASPAGGA